MKDVLKIVLLINPLHVKQFYLKITC